MSAYICTGRAPFIQLNAICVKNNKHTEQIFESSTKCMNKLSCRPLHAHLAFGMSLFGFWGGPMDGLPGPRAIIHNLKGHTNDKRAYKWYVESFVYIIWEIDSVEIICNSDFKDFGEKLFWPSKSIFYLSEECSILTHFSSISAKNEVFDFKRL